MLTERSTLTQFLIEERRRHPDSSGDLNSLILDVALACKAISRSAVALGALAGVLGKAGAVNVQGEAAAEARRLANDIFLRANEWGGQSRAWCPRSSTRRTALPAQYPRGKYLLAFDPLDGSSNIDVNVVGRQHLLDPARADARGGRRRTDGLPAARHAAGRRGLRDLRPVDDAGAHRRDAASHAFTLDPGLGEFVLTRRTCAVPDGHARVRHQRLQPALLGAGRQRYVDECLAGQVRAAREGLQHALDRVAGGRDAPHPDARRRVHVPARHQGPEKARAGCGCCTRPTRSRS